MPLALVDVVVVLASPQAGVVTPAVLDGCRSVLGAAHCVLSERETVAPATSYQAEITRVDSEGLVVKIILYRGKKDPKTDLERTLVYSARDVVELRERATGIVVAAQVLSQMGIGDVPTAPETATTPTNAVAPAPTDAPAPSAREPTRETPQPAKPVATNDRPPKAVAATPASIVEPGKLRTLAWGLDALGAIEQGPKMTRPAVGARAAVWLRPAKFPWRGFLSLRYATASDDYRLHRFGAGAGAAFCHFSWVEPKVMLLLLGNRFSATQTDPHREQSQLAYRYGLGAGTDWLLRLSRQVSLLATTEGTWLAPTYDVSVAGEARGSEGHWAYGAGLGLRFKTAAEAE